VYWFGVDSLIFIAARSWSFVKLQHFPLLLELTEMLNLRLAEFCELFIELWHCFGSLPDEMTVQGAHAQGFDSLGNDLII
jgi:hypothetical protein